MLHTVQNDWGFCWDNLSANAYPSADATFGNNPTFKASSDIAGAAWTELASAAEVSCDIWKIGVIVSNTVIGAAERSCIIDIGVDPAGGSSYVPVISNLVCGHSPNNSAGGTQWLWFPLKVKAGMSIGVRGAVQDAADFTTGYVGIQLIGKPSAPQMVWSGNGTETLGYVSGCKGTEITPGTNDFSAWVELGTTTKTWRWSQFGFQSSNATVSSEFMFIEMGYGDATNPTHIFKRQFMRTSTGESQVLTHTMATPLACNVPAGAKVYGRMSCSGAPDIATWNMVAVGVY